MEIKFTRPMMMRLPPVAAGFTLLGFLPILVATQAQALEFSFAGDEVTGSLNSTASFGQLWRVKSQDRDNDYINGNDGNRNFDPGLVSQVFKLTSELTLQYQNCLYAQDQIRFLPPLEPSQIRCFSVYVQHMKNAFAQVIKNTRGVIPNLLLRHLGLMKIPKYFFESPVYYKGTRLSLSGHQSGIRRPRADCRLDYEAELALVIGVRGKNIAERDAMKHVFGYLIFNDFSERTQLLKEMQSRPSAGPAKGKDFDGSNALGPWLVTCDEIANPENLAVQVRVNGQVVGRGSTNQMSHSIEKIVSYASWSETLYPGEMLATGCVPNCAGIEHWRFLQDGDQVEVEIEGLGSMVNSVLSVQPD